MVFKNKKVVLSERGRFQGPGALAGRGAARDTGTHPAVSLFFGLVFLLAPGAGPSAWAGVTGRSCCQLTKVLRCVPFKKLLLSIQTWRM